MRDAVHDCGMLKAMTPVPVPDSLYAGYSDATRKE
jgi:hypothetical protein